MIRKSSSCARFTSSDLPCSVPDGEEADARRGTVLSEADDTAPASPSVPVGEGDCVDCVDCFGASAAGRRPLNAGGLCVCGATAASEPPVPARKTKPRSRGTLSFARARSSAGFHGARRIVGPNLFFRRLAIFIFLFLAISLLLLRVALITLVVPVPVSSSSPDSFSISIANISLSISIFSTLRCILIALAAASLHFLLQ